MMLVHVNEIKALSNLGELSVPHFIITKPKHNTMKVKLISGIKTVSCFTSRMLDVHVKQ